MWGAEAKPYATFIHVHVLTGFDYLNGPINNYVLLLILDYLWVMRSSQTSFLEFCCFTSLVMWVQVSNSQNFVVLTRCPFSSLPSIAFSVRQEQIRFWK
jgi:hypothetical protein